MWELTKMNNRPPIPSILSASVCHTLAPIASVLAASHITWRRTSTTTTSIIAHWPRLLLRSSLPMVTTPIILIHPIMRELHLHATAALGSLLARELRLR